MFGSRARLSLELEDADAWMLRRGVEGHDDEETEGVVDLAFALGRSHFSRFEVLLLLGLDALRGESRVRAARSSSRRIGSLHADRMRVLGTEMMLRPFLVRATSTALVFAIAAAFGLRPVVAGLAALSIVTIRASALLTRSLVLHPVLVGVPAAGFALYFGRSQWWLVGLALLLGLTLHRWMQLTYVVQGPGQGYPFRFVPASARFRLLVRGSWGDFATGVDKAMHDDIRNAEPFLVATERIAPRAVLPILAAARARVLAHKGDIAEALVEVARAAELAESGRPRTTGWVALIRADIMSQVGRLEEAAAALRAAITNLHPQRDRVWYDRAVSELVEVEIARDRPPREVLGLIHEQRWRAIRRSDLPLILQTEAWLICLMRNAGNEVGALRIARRMADWAQATDERGRTPSQIVARQLILAETLLLTPVNELSQQMEAAERGAAQKHLDDIDLTMYLQLALRDAAPNADDSALRTNRELAVDYAYAALNVLRTAKLPVAEANARLLVAQGIADERPQDALAQVLAALRTIQVVRYQLPTSQWRGGWERSFSSAFRLAIDLAYDAGDTALVVEILEAARSQAIPLNRDETVSTRVTLLDSLVGEVSIGREGEPKVMGHTDLLEGATAISVEGACWTMESTDRTITLEGVLDGIAEGACYWSAAIIGDWYYWAVRDERRVWHAGRAAATSVVQAIDDLAHALPWVQGGETRDEFTARMARSALASARLRQDEQSSPEYLLLATVARLLLPDPLKGALLAWPRDMPIRLLVGLGSGLETTPVVGLPVQADDGTDYGRIVEHAIVSYCPNLALLAARRGSLRGPSAGPYPIELAILRPHFDASTSPQEAIVNAAVVPAGAKRSADGRLTKGELKALLHEIDGSEGAREAAWTLYFAAHVVAGGDDGPAAGGILLADGDRFTARDLLTTSGGQPSYPIPSRVIFAACGSLGVEATTASGGRAAAQVEWLGISAGAIAAGASDVVCTLYSIPDTSATVRLDHAIAARLSLDGSAAAALREVQLAELARWRNGERAIPLLWQAYVHVGASR